MGLDMKRGYVMKEMGKQTGSVYSNTRELEFYALMKTTGDPAGILVIINTGYSKLYFGLPLWMSEDEVWTAAKKYYSSDIAPSAWNTHYQDYLWATLKQVSLLFSDYYFGFETLKGVSGNLRPKDEEMPMQQQEAERINKEKEQDRIRLAEAERIRREQEAEQIRLEEERRKQVEQANRLNREGQNAFGRQGVGVKSGSQGVNPGTGTNQGTTHGSAGAPNYGDGNGSTYGLGSRKAVGALPLPNIEDCNVTGRIIVKVEIRVDQAGNVIGASVQSATFADNCIWNVVLEAARRSKFTSDPNASVKQTGWINYTIEP